jgi:hypothetical protein
MFDVQEDREILDRCPALCEFAFVREIYSDNKGTSWRWHQNRI